MAGNYATPKRQGVLEMRLTVGDVYTRDIITVAPDTTAPQASKLMQEHGIRRLPVVQGDRLVGIITLLDLMRAAPSPATSLSVWELNYLRDKIKVEEIMSRKVHTVTTDTDLSTVASLMREHKIGGIPVVEDGRVVGIVTESDVFRALVNLLQDEAGMAEAKTG